MEHYVGLDVSLKLTAICIVDQTGRIEREGVVASNPEAIAAFIKSHAPHVARIGLETGATSTWLWTELNKMGLPVICIDARHPKAALKMQINKSDRNDAVGIARIMQCGWYKEVRVKDLDSHAIKAFLVSRALLVKIKREACRHSAPDVDRRNRVQMVEEGGCRVTSIMRSQVSRSIAGKDVPAGTMAVVRSPDFLRALNQRDCACNIDPPASSPSCGGQAPTAERTVGPARMIAESLTAKPGIREQSHERSACGTVARKLERYCGRWRRTECLASRNCVFGRASSSSSFGAAPRGEKCELSERKENRHV
jgi:hypothetical protein